LGFVLVRVIRPHGETSDHEQDLVEDRGDLIITRFDFLGLRGPLVVHDQLVISEGYHAMLFEFFHPPLEVVGVTDADGALTGYYCNVNTEPSRIDGGYEIVDLYLDVFVLPDLRYEILDEDEFAEALEKGWIDEEQASLARETVNRVVRDIESGAFPPEVVREWVRSLSGPDRHQ
jgi:predicted RNA-binding protein associated with RNAse of E/G family